MDHVLSLYIMLQNTFLNINLSEVLVIASNYVF